MSKEFTVSFMPNYSPKEVEELSLTSFCGWQRLSQYLDAAFRIDREREVLAGVVVTEAGLTAKIVSLPSSTK